MHLFHYKKILIGLLFLHSLFLSACSLLTQQQLPTFSLSNKIETNQQLTSLVEWQSTNSNQHSTFLAVLEFDEDKSTLVAMSNAGLTLFTLVNEKGAINLNSTYLAPDFIDPLQFYNELMMTYLSEASLITQLPKQWQLIKQTDQQKNLRQFMYNDQLIISIQYSNNSETMDIATLIFPPTSNSSQHTLHLRLLERETF